ncbi:MAG: DUF2807 domain-containing protein, partial [Hyphomonadaceae bacterium]
ARDSIHVSIDGEDFEFGARRAAYVEPTAGQMAARTYAENEVRVIYSASVVQVIPEDRQDISVEITNPGRAPMPEVETRDGRVVIDGRLSRRIDGCDDDGSVRLDGYGQLSRADLPQITIRTPRDVDADFRGAVFAEVGASRSADLGFAGCGDASFGDVAGQATVDQAGSGDVRGGAVGSANVDLAGSGSVTLGAVAGSLDVDVAGSGEFEAASVNGALDASVAGSGDVRVLGGAITTANVEIAGSGDITINAPVERLEADIAGSGTVDIPNTVGDIEADFVGSGDVTVGRHTGSISQTTMGSGRVTVNNAAPAPPTPPQPPSPPAATTP